MVTASISSEPCAIGTRTVLASVACTVMPRRGVLADFAALLKLVFRKVRALALDAVHPESKRAGWLAETSRVGSLLAGCRTELCESPQEVTIRIIRQRFSGLIVYTLNPNL